MTAIQPRWAAETEVIRRLEAEWYQIAGSAWLRRRLRTWGAEDPRLTFEDGHQLVDAAQSRDAPSWAERDQVLAAVLERFEDDPVAKRVALQIVLPQVKSLINGLRGWDVEERAARVVAETVEVLSACAAEPAGTPPSFRVFTNTRRRALRAAIRHRSEPLVLAPDLSNVDDPMVQCLHALGRTSGPSPGTGTDHQPPPRTGQGPQRRSTRRQRPLHPISVEEEYPVLPPRPANPHRHELPTQPRTERMGYPNSSLLTIGIRRSRRRGPNPWPRRSTGPSRLSWSTCTAPGGPATGSRSRSSSGSTGTTQSASTPRLATSHPSSTTPMC